MSYFNVLRNKLSTAKEKGIFFFLHKDNAELFFFFYMEMGGEGISFLPTGLLGYGTGKVPEIEVR